MIRSAQRLLAILLGVVLAAGSVTATAASHTTGTLTRDQLATASAAATTGTTPLPIPAKDPTALLKAALDAQITRAFGEGGWQVTAIDSTLDTPLEESEFQPKP